tara:strand:+ start:812 stop:1444 length:633 start_codon:yes stop_codon:yes gene_type:complete
LKIWTFKGGYDNNLTYLLSDGYSNEAGIIDAAVPLSNIQPTIIKEDLSPQKLLITHLHSDHIMYLSEYTKSFPNMEVCVSKVSRKSIEKRVLSDEEKLKIGSLSFTTLHTPGHTPDSCCFYSEDVLFSGDTVFVGRTGRTISAMSNTRQLFQSITKKILTLPKNTRIYPGHDYGQVQNITLEENIKISPLLRAKDEQDFVLRMKEYEKSR